MHEGILWSLLINVIFLKIKSRSVTELKRVIYVDRYSTGRLQFANIEVFL